jgi:hypothetical protein
LIGYRYNPKWCGYDIHVKWLGYKETTWEPLDTVYEDIEESVDEFL